jgi:1-acyl-sn-glycerol-3-phosphate acyltransferase
MIVSAPAAQRRSEFSTGVPARKGQSAVHPCSEHRVSRWMIAMYSVSTIIPRFIWLFTIRAKIIRPEAAARSGGYIIALTHLSHLDPFLLSTFMRRQVDWLARREFFHYRPVAWYLRSICSIPVNRFGVPVRAIRKAIARAQSGRVIGICPEGGVTVGKYSACRGGSIKRGVCSIALRANVPILPCVMLGTHELNAVRPWLPFKRARISFAFGKPILPVGPSSKASRNRLAAQLQEEFVRLYAEMREQFGIDDRSVP